MGGWGPPENSILQIWPLCLKGLLLRSYVAVVVAEAGLRPQEKPWEHGSMSLRNAEKLVRPGSWCGTQQCKGALGD